MKQQKDELWPSWAVWLFGTIITAVLPFVVALFQYIKNDFGGKYIDYIGLSDTLAFLFSIAVNCYLLSNTKEIEHLHFRRLVAGVSLFSALITGAWYFFVSAIGQESKNVAVLIVIVILCVINMILGSFYERFSKGQQEVNNG